MPTVYVQSGFIEFRELVTRHVREVEQRQPEELSTEWFFLRYLRRLRNRAMGYDSPRDCMALMRGMTRYYVDEVEADSELARRFEEILECHRFALRTERRG